MDKHLLSVLFSFCTSQRNVPGNQYVKNYEFDFAFGQPWGNCSVTMTSVIGHLTGTDFPPQYKKWQVSTCRELFDAPIVTTVAEVGRSGSSTWARLLSYQTPRTKSPLRETSLSKLDFPRHCSSGRIVIEKESTLAPRYGKLPWRASLQSRSSEQYSVTRNECKNI